jgi:hypothetical protein
MTEGASKIINDKQFAGLVKAVDENKTKVASLNGAIGERIQHAAENAHLHPGAFKLICKLYRMDEQKRDEFLRQFDIYREKAIKMGLFGEEHVGDMVEQAEEQTQEEADARAAAENSKLLEKGIGQLSDEEREFDDTTSSKPSRRRPRKADAEDADEAAGTYQVTH